MNIILLGAPGAGKGTQAETLIQIYNVPTISTGNIFRDHIAKQTELGKKAKGYMDLGQLVPDELVIELIKDRIIQEDCNDGMIMDGFPRTIPQAQAFDTMLAELGRKIDCVIDVKVPNHAIIERMAGRTVCPDCGASFHNISKIEKTTGLCDFCGATLVQRIDDKEETVRKRLEIYQNQTAPLIKYFAEQGKLIELDGVGEVAEVRHRLKDALGVN
ncbi:MAG TPA: adenylate kinase [Epulopiscium sp.]|nr:adenylate kinase [Candidatus Epulonipiscium sp.]